MAPWVGVAVGEGSPAPETVGTGAGRANGAAVGTEVGVCSISMLGGVGTGAVTAKPGGRDDEPYITYVLAYCIAGPLVCGEAVQRPAIVGDLNVTILTGDSSEQVSRHLPVSGGAAHRQEGRPRQGAPLVQVGSPESSSLVRYTMRPLASVRMVPSSWSTVSVTRSLF